MAIALVSNTAKGSASTTSVTTDAIDTTGASLLVVEIADYKFATAGTLSDSGTNTWTGLTTYEVPAAGITRSLLFYATNVSGKVGSGHTFTYSSAGATYPALAVTAWSGAHDTSPFDVENGAISSGDASVQTGSVTPSEDGELIITGLCFSVSATASINLSFSITDQINLTANNFGVAMAYQIQTTATARNPQWDSTAMAEFATGIATFKVAAGAPAGQPTIKRWANVPHVGGPLKFGR